MATALGPQSPNFTTTRPALDAVVSAVDTWFKDCSAAGAADGTILSASWLNVILAQLRTAVTSAGIALSDADDTMLWQAIQKAAGGTHTAGATAPTTPKFNDTWFSTVTGLVYIWTTDGASNFWLQV